MGDAFGILNFDEDNPFVTVGSKKSIDIRVMVQQLHGAQGKIVVGADQILGYLRFDGVK